MAIRAYSVLSTKQTKITLDNRKLEKLAKELPEKAYKVVRQVAFNGEGYAKMRARVDTSAMQNSIHVVTSQGETDYEKAAAAAQSAASGRGKTINLTQVPKPEGKIAASWGPAVDYSIWIEFGTSRMPAYPFMYPSAVLAEKDLIKLLKEELLKG